MHGYMNIEQRDENGQWQPVHAGEFVFPDDEAVNAAAALLAAFTDGEKDYPADRLRLCVWSNKLPVAERDLAHAAAVFTLAAVHVADHEGGIWTRAARLLRWGALASFSCEDQPVPTAIALNALPAALSGALPVKTKRHYWYHPADGQDTSCESRKRFEYVLEGAEEIWLTLRSAQEAATWGPGETVAIAERMAEGTLRHQMSELHDRLGPEADERLHALVAAHRAANAELEPGDTQGRDALRQRFRQETAGLFYHYQDPSATTRARH